MPPLSVVTSPTNPTVNQVINQQTAVKNEGIIPRIAGLFTPVIRGLTLLIPLKNQGYKLLTIRGMIH